MILKTNKFTLEISPEIIEAVGVVFILIHNLLL